MTAPDPVASPDERLRQQLENAGLYNILIHLHEQKHIKGCFCTTEISGAYAELLKIIAAKITASNQALLERLRSSLGVNVESFGSIPAEVVERAINKELAALGPDTEGK